MTEAPLFSHMFDLSSLPQAGGEEFFEVPEAPRAAIAAAYKIEALEDLTARLQLSRISKNEYLLAGSFKATVLQKCVVSLKPMRTRLDQDLTRRYRVMPSNWKRKDVPVLDLALEEAETEVVSNPVVDLAAPVLEELSLAIDPYPRVEGVAFEAAPDEPEREDSPFAVLKALKEPKGPPEKT